MYSLFTLTIKMINICQYDMIIHIECINKTKPFKNISLL